MKERDQSLDILRGIGIFLMVFDHVGWGSLVHTYIQSFHMPLFFIVSGYLWKIEETSLLVKKRFKALMIPYAFFSTLFLILQMLPTLSDGHSFMNSVKAILIYPTDMENMPIAPALWFLPCMFFTSIAYSLLSRISFKLKASVIVTLSAFGMVFSSLSDIMLPFTIEPLTVALGFMLIGELIYKNQDKAMSLLDKPWIIVSLLIAEAIIAIINGSVDMRSARYHNSILYIINSIAGTMAYWGIARKICIKSSKICKWLRKLSFFSLNAMGFICLNQLCIMIIGKVVKMFMLDGTIALIVSKSAIFIGTMIIVSFITRMIKRSRIKMILGGK